MGRSKYDHGGPTTKEEVVIQAAIKSPDMTRPRGASGRIVQLFVNVSMGMQHNGLSLLCEEYGIKVSDLEPGQWVCFTNRARDKIKVYGANNVLAYVRLPPGATVSLEAVALIPLAFKGSPDIDLTAELAKIFGRDASPKEIEEGTKRRILVRP